MLRRSTRAIFGFSLRRATKYPQSRSVCPFSTNFNLSGPALPPKLATIEKFQFPKKTHTVAQVSEEPDKYISKKTQITLHGWIDHKPTKLSKELLFVNFRDCQTACIAQLMASDAETVAKLRKLKPEDAIAVTGTVVPRHGQPGLWDLSVDAVYLLNSAGLVGLQYESLKTTSPFDFPPEMRYLQLRQKQFQNILRKRSQAALEARNTLVSEGFVEVETPLLFKSTPEGAREFLVPTRRKNSFYALPQSPQQYKQLLMASGVPKYFQIAKCFRDEDLRADRQPEFAQIDLEMAFASPSDVQEVVEKLVSRIWQKVGEKRIYVPKGSTELELYDPETHGGFPKMKYAEALSRYGIDKPDLRSTLEFIDVSEYVENVANKQFGVIEVCVLRGVDKEGLDQIKNPENYKARMPAVQDLDQDLGQFLQSVPFATFKNVDGLKSKLKLQQGRDVIAISDRASFPYENPTPLGRLRQVAIEAFPNNWRRTYNGEVPKHVFVAHWMEEFPLFSPLEVDTEAKYPVYDFSKFVATHHPFTMLKMEDYDLLANEETFLRVRGDHYDLVMNGVEVGGGSRRIHDPALQNYIFHNILKIKQPEKLFGHLLKAFESGCPPHAGLAIGFDRMIAMLLGHQSIRNVIAFPKNQSGSDVVVGSPSKVEATRLRDYHVQVR